MSCCDSTQISDCNKTLIYIRNDCGTINKNSPSIEIGSHYQNKKLVPFLGIGVHKTYSNKRFASYIGVDYEQNAYLSFRYQYIPFRTPNNTLNPISWGGINWANNTQYFSEIFIGSELISTYDFKTSFAINQDIHLGISTEPNYISIFAPRFFLKYGYSINYASNDFKLTPKFTFGINTFF